MEINCLGCGFKVDLTDTYDDYVGQIKCFACGATMEIATQAGEVRAVECRDGGAAPCGRGVVGGASVAAAGASNEPPCRLVAVG
jgi:DNA-directed RNA polymerase subunit RPC12/RpoP